MRQVQSSPQRSLFDGGSMSARLTGWAMLGFAAIARRRSAKPGTRTWYSSPQDEQNFHWRER